MEFAEEGIDALKGDRHGASWELGKSPADADRLGD
jgi:hypothetical protein